MSARILVTGGSGYLGPRRRPAGRDRATGGLGRPTRPQPVEAVHYLTEDLRSLDLAAVLAEHEVRAVVHLAAIVEPPRGMSEEELEEIEVGGTQRVIDACLAAGVEHLTVTSSGAAYGYHARNDGRLLAEQGRSRRAHSPTPGTRLRSRRSAQDGPTARARPADPASAPSSGDTDNQITALTSPVVMCFAKRPIFVWDGTSPMSSSRACSGGAPVSTTSPGTG